MNERPRKITSTEAKIQLEKIIATDPAFIRWDTNLYLVRFGDNKEVSYNNYGMSISVECWWNDKGNTFKDRLTIRLENFESVIKKFEVN
jgi:hypothetical protein